MSPRGRLEAEDKLLHHVKDKATLDAVRGLVPDMPALVHYQDVNGNNPLHTAAETGRAVPVICALIKEGVDPTTRNRAGQIPAEVASEAGHALQATLLERAADDKRKRDLLLRQQRRSNV